MSRVVYMNGDYVPEKDAKISIYDSALMFGDMVFEMTRSFNKKQFKLREHLERLYASMRYVHIPLPMTVDEMEKICNEVIEKNDLFFEKDDEHRLMINVSRGPLSLYADVFNSKIEPTVVISDFPLKWTVAQMAPLFDEGIHAVIPSQRAIPANLLEPKVKNRSRLHYLMANVEVSHYQGENNWALLLDPDGFVAEGTGANFFIVKNGQLITPEPRNILCGISRAYIFELAEQLGLECIEKNIEPYDVMQADEAFMTATPFCMVPVTKLNNTNIGNGQVGELFHRFLGQWSENVGVNIEGQIKQYHRAIQGKSDVVAASPYAFRGDDES